MATNWGGSAQNYAGNFGGLSLCSIGQRASGKRATMTPGIKHRPTGIALRLEFDGNAQEFTRRQNRLQNIFAALIDPDSEELGHQEVEKKPEITIGGIIQKAFEDKKAGQSKQKRKARWAGSASSARERGNEEREVEERRGHEGKLKVTGEPHEHGKEEINMRVAPTVDGQSRSEMAAMLEESTTTRRWR